MTTNSSNSLKQVQLIPHFDALGYSALTYFIWGFLYLDYSNAFNIFSKCLKKLLWKRKRMTDKVLFLQGKFLPPATVTPKRFTATELIAISSAWISCAISPDGRLHANIRSLEADSIMGLIKKNVLLNPFAPNAYFLFPLKTSENRKAFCFHGVEKGCIENIWVKDILCQSSQFHSNKFRE